MKNKTAYIWGLIGRFAPQVIYLATTMILARFLTPDDFGQIGVLSVIFTVAYVLMDSGLGGSLIKEKDMSNFFITEFYINSIVALLCNSECNFSYSQKIRMVKDLWNEKFMTPNFYKSSVLRMIKKSPKIGVAYFFCKYKFYSLLFVMHSLRNWQLNSKIFNKILNIKSYGF